MTEWKNLRKTTILPFVVIASLVLLLIVPSFRSILSSAPNNSTFTIPSLLIVGIVIGIQLAKNKNYFLWSQQSKKDQARTTISPFNLIDYPEPQVHYYQLVIEREIWKLENIRGWISHELHEDLAQTLVAAKNYLQTDLDTKSPTNTYIVRAGQILEEAIGKVKKLYERLEVPPLKLLGLRSCLQQKIDLENKNGYTRIILENKEQCSADLEEPIMLVAYRIISEKINNINKHSKANNAWIQIEQQIEALTIKVVDDGVGFYNSKRYWKNGLHMINTMVSSLGGTITIQSAPGRGCKFLALIPIKSDLNHSFNAFNH
jgi:signal transduction histidine kinase